MYLLFIAANLGNITRISYLLF